MVIQVEKIENGKVRIICFKQESVKPNAAQSEHFYDVPDNAVSALVDLAECGKITSDAQVRDFINDYRLAQEQE